MYKRSRCSRATDARVHQPGSSSLGAIARTSFFVLYSVFKERRVEWTRGPGSTMLPTFWGARRSGAHRQDLPVASPAALVPTSGGLRFEAECQPTGDFDGRQTEVWALRTAPWCMSPPQWRIDNIARPTTGTNSPRPNSSGQGD